nr:MAG: hypothetical protein [Microvirus sp.]
MIRKDTNPRIDKKVFRNTATQSRKINICPNMARGGIRL